MAIRTPAPARIVYTFPDRPLHVARPRAAAVAIVDDQPVARAGFERLTSQLGGLVTVTASVDVVDKLDLRSGNYDLVLLSLPLHTNRPALDIIEEVASVSRPLILSAWDQAPALLPVVRAGARACLTRHSDQEAITAALEVVAGGGFYLCRHLVDLFHDELSRPAKEDPNRLAPREVETLRLIAQGYTQSQIATRMGLSQATVNTYARRIRSKLNVNNKAALVQMAIKLGHVDDAR
ncbi:response regulator transcription factor [Dactylosporangium sp. NPDC005572]|uniref:response regulator transcription factor n=1 Tax=Dactylosporangium sp. NPDC005572 TaxID=3156889 RepID=UPI0033BCA8C6